MEQLLPGYIYLPLLAFFTTLFFSRKRETVLSTIAIGSVGIHLFGLLALAAYWGKHDFETIDIKHLVLYRTETFEFFINFYVDKTTLLFSLIGSLIALLVCIFSRYYMHRDEGFKRFFSLILLFYVGYNFVVFSGNFETLFIGWEILGICSFLLIAFYRDRYLPVKNGMKAISLFRLGDICLILAMWMMHHLFHRNITFGELNSNGIPEHGTTAIYFIALMVVIAAAIKSAQIPFSSWLPRAMEGPTVSSAIFYGSLSIHLGIFLLIRTWPIWNELLYIKILLIIIGAATGIIASGIANVQSSVKTQIAYASIAQIGIMFIEVALGWHTLALVHFAGNAFLRTYQLLVSPSVLNYLIHDQFFNYEASRPANKSGFIQKVKNTLYINGLREWGMDNFLFTFLWSPFKFIGRRLQFMHSMSVLILVFLLFGAGIYCLLMEAEKDYPALHYLPLLFTTIAMLYIVKAFTERTDAIRSWLEVSCGQLFLLLAISLNEELQISTLLMYVVGIAAAAILGYSCLVKTRAIDNDISLNRFHGYSYEKPTLALLFLVASLGMIGFPITPAFIGLDVLLTHIHSSQIYLIIAASIFFLVIEISVLRIYARIFLGQHKKAYHPIAYRSS